MPAFGFNRQDGETPAPIPAGRYETIIRSSDFKLTRSGGERLVLGVDVIAGSYTGRRIWHAINVAGSDGAINHGRRALAKLLGALKLDKIEDTEELHGKPLMADVRIESSFGYDDKNTIDDWHPLEDKGARQGLEPAAPVARAAPAAQDAQARRTFMNNGNQAKSATPKPTAAEICGEDIPF